MFQDRLSWVFSRGHTSVPDDPSDLPESATPPERATPEPRIDELTVTTITWPGPCRTREAVVTPEYSTHYDTGEFIRTHPNTMRDLEDWR